MDWEGGFLVDFVVTVTIFAIMRFFFLTIYIILGFYLYPQLDEFLKSIFIIVSVLCITG